MADFLQTTFWKSIFLNANFYIFIQILLKSVVRGPHNICIISGNDLGPIRWQAITWTNGLTPWDIPRPQLICRLAGGCFNIRMWSYQCRISDNKDKVFSPGKIIIIKQYGQTQMWTTFLCKDASFISVKAWWLIQIYRCHLSSIGNTIVEIRQSYGPLISIMRFLIVVSWHLYTETGCRAPSQYKDRLIYVWRFPC